MVWATASFNGSELAVAAAIEHCSHLLIGIDPQRIEDIWYLLYHYTYWREGPLYAAPIGAIDIALWDIRGKVANTPVYQLLGGAALDKILPTGTLQEVEESVRRLQEKGYQVIRAQIGVTAVQVWCAPSQRRNRASRRHSILTQRPICWST